MTIGPSPLLKYTEMLLNWQMYHGGYMFGGGGVIKNERGGPAELQSVVTGDLTGHMT